MEKSPRHQQLKTTRRQRREHAGSLEPWSLAHWQVFIDDAKASGSPTLVMADRRAEELGPDLPAVLRYANHLGVKVVGPDLPTVQRIIGTPRQSTPTADGSVTDRGSPDEPSRSASTGVRAVTPRQSDQLVSAYHEGWTVERLATIANLDTDAVRQVLIERGIRLRGRSELRQAVCQHVRSRVDRFTLTELEHSCGASRPTVRSIVDELIRTGEVEVAPRARAKSIGRKPRRYRVVRPKDRSVASHGQVGPTGSAV